jgi:SAM-dependent methyltransferase
MMQPNYAFVLTAAERLCSSRKATILDYGCGSGDIVQEGIKRGLDIFGVDIFYEGNPARRREVEGKGLLNTRVFAMNEGRIPFTDSSFDLVVSNMVIEHVEDLKSVLSEIARVLRPHGKFLCLFPTLETVREGHCGIPMVHWFGRESLWRSIWMYFFCSIGFGYNKNGKPIGEWCKYYLDWLDKFTFYRQKDQIEAEFATFFGRPISLEPEYIAFRLKRYSAFLDKVASIVPFRRLLFVWVCRRFAGMVILVEKRL